MQHDDYEQVDAAIERLVATGAVVRYSDLATREEGITFTPVVQKMLAEGYSVQELVEWFG